MAMAPNENNPADRITDQAANPYTDPLYNHATELPDDTGCTTPVPTAVALGYPDVTLTVTDTQTDSPADDAVAVDDGARWIAFTPADSPVAAVRTCGLIADADSVCTLTGDYR